MRKILFYVMIFGTRVFFSNMKPLQEKHPTTDVIMEYFTITSLEKIAKKVSATTSIIGSGGYSRYSL